MEKILELRRFEQSEAELELGKANAEVARIQNNLDEVAEKYAAMTESCNSNNDFEFRAQAESYFFWLRQKRDFFLKEKAQAELVAEEKRKIMQEAMKKVKVLEKLRERKFSDWKKEMQKEEEINTDDIVTSQFASGVL